ncbi:helix-turn-helix transcriptional regulator [uncultured Polaribacter sp.]|uniref:helix-turn-helix domain-containing protein n=1 Tax=uncultured Polaribacter sp. TaxID=174711 RepID=UPI002626D6A5|nr:helix-turn-helix transcriptional regulator [uncultured Polaribacter sp.]
MKTQIDISKLLEIGKIQNELDFESALIADRKLRMLSKENSKYKVTRKKLRDLIEDYENKNWSSNSRLTDKKIRESDLAELIAEKERQFIQNRKELIRKKLKNLNLTQQNLGEILGHRSKSYMSELMNGLSPFSLKDLIVINRLLKIDLANLVSTFLPQSDRVKIRTSIEKLDNPKLTTLSKDGFAFT